MIVSSWALKFSLFEKLEANLDVSPLDLKFLVLSKITSSVIVVISKCYHEFNLIIIFY